MRPRTKPRTKPIPQRFDVAKRRHGPWSRRAQEYEAKLNSGDPVSIAEVLRDLHRAEDQPEQSYSERQLYEAALDVYEHAGLVGARHAYDKVVVPPPGA